MLKMLSYMFLKTHLLKRVVIIKCWCNYEGLNGAVMDVIINQTLSEPTQPTFGFRTM